MAATTSPTAGTTGRRDHRLLARALLVVGALLAALGLVAGYANRELLDGPTFAGKVDAVRRDPAVADQVGQVVAAQLVMARPDLVAIGPLVEELSVRVVGGDLLSGPTRRAAGALHAALTEPGADALVLRLADAGAIVAGVLAVVAPERAPAAGDVSVALVAIGDQSFASQALALAALLGRAAWLLPLLAAACLVGSVLLSRDRWRRALQAGLALLAAAALVGVALVVGGVLVGRLDDATLGGAVGQATWREFVVPLWRGVAVLGAIGGVVAVAAGTPATALAGAPGLLERWATSARGAAWRRPTTPAQVAGRAVVVGLVGLAAMADPGGVVRGAAFLAGAALVLFAVAQVAGLGAPRPRPAPAGATPAEGGTSAAGPDAPPSGDLTPGRRPRRGVAVAAALAVAAGLVGVGVLARPGRDLAADDTTRGEGVVCNGHAELCDRPFDEVVQVGSHNAMSIAGEPGWFLAEQSDPIPVQLDQGVRALLVDVWSGRPAGGGVVRTSPESYAEALAVTEAELGPDIVAAAGRIADAIAGTPEGPEARYMCHGLCETGSTPFLDMLAELRAWLASHPDEVVTLFVEDHVPADLIAEDVVAAGLLPFVHEPVPGRPWPTLGELIRSGERLVVMVEEGSGGEDAPWLVNGFEHTQDTPYTFPTPESFSCAPNRGPADAPLLLVNHWLSGFSALATNAQRVNGRDVLLPRAEACRDERGRATTILAVNFVAIGDVFAVADELNGVG